MKTLDFVSIPRMFSAYAGISQNEMRRGAVYRTTQYYCLACGSGFHTSWKYQGSAHGFKDSVAYCAQCGAKHVASFSPLVTRYLSENEPAPINLSLGVVEGKDFIALKILAETIRFTELSHTIKGSVAEEFRFNFQKRKTIFRRKIDRRLIDEFEIGSPFERAVFDISLLRFLTADSAANGMRGALSRLLKTLRKALHDKLERRCGHKIKSMHTSCGSVFGRLLFPLYNMAYRVIFLDAPNLPGDLRDGDHGHGRFQSLRGLGDDDAEKFGKLDYFRGANNCIAAVISLYGLPDVRCIRRILQADLFACQLLQQACSITRNIDHLIRFYRVLSKMQNPSIARYWNYVDAHKFCADLVPIYGVDKIIRLLEVACSDSCGDLQRLRDVLDMYSRLSVANRRLLPQVRFDDLHDWLAVKVVEQHKIGCIFEVPESIRRRLMMQKDSVRFFLPEKSAELSVAGKVLHNCVGTYINRMSTNRVQIVLVADDSGKLVACLEVQDGRLVQAKLKYNKPVAQNAKINAEVIEWAASAGLRIQTSDVRKFYLPAVIAAV